jgi:hypothetical protein
MGRIEHRGVASARTARDSTVAGCTARTSMSDGAESFALKEPKKYHSTVGKEADMRAISRSHRGVSFVQVLHEVAPMPSDDADRFSDLKS